MTIRKFQQRPPVIEGVRWDGTIEGVQDVLDLIRTGRISVGYYVHTRFNHDATKTYSELIFDKELNGPTGYVKRENNHKMLQGDWLVKHVEGSFEIFDNETFLRDYAEMT